MPTLSTLALIAHDSRTAALADFVLNRRAAFSRFHLVAPRDTGTVLQKQTRLPIGLLDAGLAGGDQQLGRLAEANAIQAVIFFRDPAGGHPLEPNFACLLQICDAREIPLATNGGTAEAVLYFLRHSPDRVLVAARSCGQEAPPCPAAGGRTLISTDLQAISSLLADS
ncbi:MAG TPA: methylglyoxal synthase [Chloroflexia bacterium]|nr:methylglyoxal synthase [Chloroflexia bacterium]